MNRKFFFAKGFYQFYYASLILNNTFNVVLIFFLVRTKLWNALYERWCRLPRVNPFCPEQCWWFPQPAISDVRDGGVVTTVIGSGGADAMEWDESSDNGMTPLNEADEEGDALSFLFRDPRMARILTAIPQSLSFERRVKLFTSLVASTKKGAGDDGSIMASSFFMDREQVQIRRANIYKDSMEQLNGLGRDLRKQIQVTFINQVDAPEAGECDFLINLNSS